MIETERLILRPWHDDDGTPFLSMLRDPEVMEHLGPLGDAAEAERIVAGQQLNQRLFGHCFWALERRSDGVFIGFCGLNPGPVNTPLEGRIEIGWRLARDCWGQGYAREAADAALAWGFGNLPVDRIFAITTPANSRSWGLMERLGMTRRHDMDFDHPGVPDDSPLKAHLTYEARRPA